MVDIRKTLPPNIEAIKAMLPISGKEIFAYDNVIYNPSGSKLGPELIAHEQVHFRQQGNDPAGWWVKFLDDPQFRLEQELEAHRVEYRTFCKHNRDRNRQILFLQFISRRLASPIYGSILTVAQAMKKIK